MDVNASRTGRGIQHSEAKKNELMANNQCFYCKIRGHHARDCHKKQADCCNFKSGPANNPSKSRPTTNCAAPTAPDITSEDISNFLKENMGSLDKDTKLRIVKSLMPKDFTEAQN